MRIANPLLKHFEDNDDMTPMDRWNTFEEVVKRAIKKEQIQVTNPVYNIVFTYTFPRLDVNVSKGLNHLLKSPFCVHPDTGRISVPFSASECEDFDPSEVPTIHTLLEEMKNSVNIKDAETQQKPRKSICTETSLKKICECF